MKQGAQVSSSDAGESRADPAAALKVRARRRLIGAAALLLAVVVIVPALLDTTPKPLPDSIPIEIPGEKAPFTPRLSLPPLPEPMGSALPPEQPTPAEAKTEVKQELDKKATVDKPTDAKAADAKRARELLEGRGSSADKSTRAAKSRYLLQAAALSSETAARELLDRIIAAGMKPYVEKVDTKDGARFRVRVGPYTNRDEAEQARSRLRALGVNANLVPA